MKGIVRYGVVVSNVVFKLCLSRKLGKIPIVTYMFQRGSIYIIICMSIIYIYLYVVISYKDQISSTHNVSEG